MEESRIILIKEKKVVNFHQGHIYEDILVKLDKKFKENVNKKDIIGIKITTNCLEKYGNILIDLLKIEINKPLYIYLNGFSENTDKKELINDLIKFKNKSNITTKFISKSKYLIKSFNDDYRNWINLLRKNGITKIKDINFDFNLI